MSDLDILARTLYGEAEADNLEDACAIASVIMNRAKFPNWPNNVEGVCLQPWQFSCWNPHDPGRERILDARGPWFEQCKAIASSAINGELEDPTHTSTHYYATYVKKPKWAVGKQAVYTVPHRNGNSHLFFNNIDTRPPESAQESLDQQRPLSDTKTVRAAKAATGGAAGILSIAGAVHQATPALPLISQIMSYAPWFVIGVLFIGICYMLWCRIDDRKKGLR
jgi:hypothetical protein